MTSKSAPNRAGHGPERPGNRRPAAGGDPGKQAGRCPGAIAIFLAVSALGLAADLLSKHYVFESLLNDPELVAQAEAFRAQFPAPPKTEHVLYQFQRPLFAGIKLTLSTNPGVVFGWSAMPPWLVVIVTTVTVALVGYFFATSPSGLWSVHLALGCILSGALGNLYDRLLSEVSPLGMEPIRRNVRDFVDCADLHYPWVFNVADVLLVVGVSVLTLHWLLSSFCGRPAQSGTQRMDKGEG